MEWAAAFLEKAAAGGFFDAFRPVAETVMRLVNYLILHFSILRP